MELFSLQNRLKLFFTKIVLPLNQIIVASISFTIAMIILMVRLPTFVAFDSKPILQNITPADIREWAKGATDVKVGLHISNFHKFDIYAGKFGFNGIVWFEFDPATISLDTISKFSFEQGEIKQKSAPEARIINGKLFVRYTIDVEFSSSLNFKDFPLDNHYIHISLVNGYVAPNEMVFESYYSYLSADDKEIANWILVNKRVELGYSKLVLDVKDTKKNIFVPKVVFTLDFQNFGARNAALIFLPLFILFLLSLFSLSFDPLGEHKQNIGSITLTSLTGIIAYRFVINQLSPVVGYYTLSDYVFMLTFVCTISVNFLAMVIMEKSKITSNLAISRGVVFLSSHIILLTFWCYFLYL